MANRKYKFKFLSYDTRCFNQKSAVKIIGLEGVKEPNTLDIIERLIPRGVWRPGVYYLSKPKEPWIQITYPDNSNCLVYFKGVWYWYFIYLEHALYDYRELTVKEWAAMKTLGPKKLSRYQQKVYHWWLWEFEKRSIKVNMGLQGYKIRKRLSTKETN